MFEADFQIYVFIYLLDFLNVCIYVQTQKYT